MTDARSSHEKEEVAGIWLYYRDSDDAVIGQDLDGLMLLFHRPSGITHIVDSPVPELLNILTEEPISVSAILGLLKFRYDMDDIADLPAILTDHLDHLCALGLVRRKRDGR